MAQRQRPLRATLSLSTVGFRGDVRTTTFATDTVLAIPSWSAPLRARSGDATVSLSGAARARALGMRCRQVVA